MQHLTVRVAWHDRGWDGTVCAHPSENSFCLALKRIRESRDDAREDAIAGRHWGDLDPDDQPPCRQEAAAFMSGREWTRVLEHPYQKGKATQETHGHLRPTPVKVPPYSTFAVPFAWMTRRGQDDIAEGLPDRLPEDREPPFHTAWVFGRQRQQALLKTFFDALTPSESLVFFYTKEGQPISDSINRLVVGVGRLTKVSSMLEYASEGSKSVYPMWDRLVQHSIRPDKANGFVLPYHEFSEATVYRWIAQDEVDAGERPGVRTGENVELSRARSRISDLCPHIATYQLVGLSRHCYDVGVCRQATLPRARGVHSGSTPQHRWATRSATIGPLRG